MAASNISGLVSGMDSNAIIDAMKGVKEIQINNLKKQKLGIESQISKVGTIKSAMKELTSFLEEFATDDEVIDYTGATSDEDVLTVSTGAGTLPGNYDIEVTQLAEIEKNRSGAFESTVTEVKAGTIDIQVKDEDAVEVEITAGMSLNEVADAINASDAEVFASVINDGTNVYLQVSAKESGHVIGEDPNDAIIITENYTGTEGQELNLTQVTAAANATLNVDGLAVEATSNNVSEVLEGVTLEVKELGTVQVTVEPDKAATKENLEEFVSMFNEAFIPVSRELKVTEDTDYSSSLAGDSSIKRLKLAMQTGVTGIIPGTTGSWAALSEIGIEMDPTGKLEIDADKLDDALDKDIAGIADLFTIDDVGISDRLVNIMDPYIEDLEGTFKDKVESYNDRIDLIDDEIEDQRWRIEKMVARLTMQFANMEIAVQNFNSQGGALAGLAAQ
jgi:flagellar hook-associated protein 2